MIIQKYLLPVSFAATLHAALLWSYADKPVRIFTKLIEVPLPPLPKPDEVVTLPPEDKGPASQPVKSLPSAPTPPDIPDSPVMHKPDAIPVPMEPPRLSWPRLTCPQCFPWRGRLWSARSRHRRDCRRLQVCCCRPQPRPE